MLELWKATAGSGERRYRGGGCRVCSLLGCTRRGGKKEQGAKDVCLRGGGKFIALGKLGKEWPGGT